MKFLPGAFLFVGPALANPQLERAVSMIKELRVKAVDDMQAEKVQWARYDQFVRSETSRLERELDDLGVRANKTSADSHRLKGEAEGLDTVALEANATLTTLMAEKHAMEEEDKRASHEYQVASDDLHGAISALEKAVAHLKARKKYNKQMEDNKYGEQFLQDAWGATDLAKLDKFKNTHTGMKRLLALAQKGDNDKFSDSRSVIDTLRDLRSTFMEEREQLMKAEQNRKYDYQMVHSTTGMQVDKQERLKLDSMQKAEANRAEAGELAAQANEYRQMLNTVSVELSDLTSTHATKSTQFEDRQAARTNELKALDDAVSILSSPLQVKSFLQRTPHTRSLLQLSNGKAAQQEAVLATRKLEVYYFLSDRAASAAASSSLQQTLSFLATAAKNDAFQKVIDMIRELLGRLEKEAAEEATHNKWCTEEVTKTEANQDTAMDSLEKAANKITGFKGAIVKLQEEISDLGQQKNATMAQQAEETELYTVEKTQRDKEIGETAEAVTALQNAMTMLQEAYSQNAFVQTASTRVHRQAPEIFDDSPYTGQGGGTGVLNFLEFLKVGFDAENKELTADAAEAQQKYEAAQKELDLTIGKLDTGVNDAIAGKAEKEAKLETTKSDLEGAKADLEKANAYYDELRPSCIAPFENKAEDRAKERQQTIDACQTALTLLNGMR